MTAHLFRFKQFALKQEKSAMKIGTDGVLLGAWANHPHPRKILDIGAGTGLVGMMLAQRFPQAEIIGIEIDSQAAQEAQENVAQSPFKARCEIVETSLQNYETQQKFDLIVSNPPFFESHLNEISSRFTARQQAHLTFEELLLHSKNLLAENGICAYIIPFDSNSKLIGLAEIFSLFPHKILQIRGNENAPIKRSLIAFGLSPIQTEISELIIEKQRHIYTEDYINLTQDFYLKM